MENNQNTNREEKNGQWRGSRGSRGDSGDRELTPQRFVHTGFLSCFPKITSLGGRRTLCSTPGMLSDTVSSVPSMVFKLQKSPLQKGHSGEGNGPVVRELPHPHQDFSSDLQNPHTSQVDVEASVKKVEA